MVDVEELGQLLHRQVVLHAAVTAYKSGLVWEMVGVRNVERPYYKFSYL